LVSNKARPGLIDLFDGTEQGVSGVVDDDVEAPKCRCAARTASNTAPRCVTSRGSTSADSG
jgi:hypothetical protein